MGEPMTDERRDQLWGFVRQAEDAGVGGGHLRELLTEVDRLRDSEEALTSLIDTIKSGAKELIEALPTSRLDGMTASEIDAYEDCAETWHEMIREVLGDA